MQEVDEAVFWILDCFDRNDIICAFSIEEKVSSYN